MDTEFMTLVAAKSQPKAKVDKARKSISSGTIEADFWAHFKGPLVVGVDYDSAPTVAMPHKKLVAAMFWLMGNQRINAEKVVFEAMKMVMSTSKTVADKLCDSVKNVERIEAEIIDPMLKKLKKQGFVVRSKGVCKFKGTVDFHEVRDE